MYGRGGGGGSFRGGLGGGLGLPPLTPTVKKIIIACVVIALAQWMLLDDDEIGPGGASLTWWLSISAYGVSDGNVQFMLLPWQFATYMWLHGDLGHLLFNMLGLYFLGGDLERLWGARRFFQFYLTTGIGAGVVIWIWDVLWGSASSTLGASGAIFGVLTAFSVIYADRQIMLMFPPIPMRAIFLLPVAFGFTLVFGWNANVSHIGHLGGVLVALYLIKGDANLGFAIGGLGSRWHRYRMRKRLRAVRREEWERRRDENDRHNIH